MNHASNIPMGPGTARDTRHATPFTPPLWRRYLIWPFFLWALVWSAVNTGPWRLRYAGSTMDYIHGWRAYAVFVPAVIALGYLIQRPQSRRLICSGGIGLLLIYGVVGLVSSMLISSRPDTAVYWAAAYVAALLAPAAMAVQRYPTLRARDFVRLNWLVILIIAGVIVFLGGEHLFGAEIKWDEPERFRAVEPVGMEGVADIAMPRSTGAGRYTGLFAVVALAGLWNGRMWERAFWGPIFVIFGLATLLYHGRGAAAGFMGGCLAVLAFSGSGGKRSIALFGLVAAPIIIFPDILEWIIAYMQRGQDPERFMTFTGRTRDWAIGWELFKGSPVIGLGFWADRIYVPLGHHFHNSFVYALVTGGALGFIPFVMVWIWAWMRFLKLQRIQMFLPPAEARTLIEVGGVLTFLTLRSFPESTGAFFGVDLFIFVPILIYLQIIGDTYLRANQRPAHRAPARAAVRPMRPHAAPV